MKYTWEPGPEHRPQPGAPGSSLTCRLRSSIDHREDTVLLESSQAQHGGWFEPATSANVADTPPRRQDGRQHCDHEITVAFRHRQTDGRSETVLRGAWLLSSSFNRQGRGRNDGPSDGCRSTGSSQCPATDFGLAPDATSKRLETGRFALADGGYSSGRFPAKRGPWCVGHP